MLEKIKVPEIAGRILMPGIPEKLAQAAIILLHVNNSVGRTLAKSETDAQGDFKFINIPSGIYYLEIKSPIRVLNDYEVLVQLKNKRTTNKNLKVLYITLGVGVDLPCGGGWVELR
jgi:hypothetical protein